MGSTRCSMRSTVVACGATSTRTGSLRKPWARPETSAGMVAEKSADWRRGCSAATIFRTGWMKPMSSMRSASSRTTQRVWSRRIERSAMRSVSRPGVATTTSTPRAMARTWALRETPPRTRSVVSLRAAGEGAEGGLDLHGELAGGGEDQRAAGLGRRAALEREELVQDRQGEGGGLAGAGLGDAEDVAARHLRGDGLGLDRRGGVEAGAGERVGQGGREAEGREGGSRHEIFLSAQALAVAVDRPRQAHVTKTGFRIAMPGA